MFGDYLKNLQGNFAASPMNPPVGGTQLPSTQANMGLLGSMGRSGFTPNYTGLFGMMGPQPTTEIPVAPTPAPTPAQPTTQAPQVNDDMAKTLGLVKNPYWDGVTEVPIGNVGDYASRYFRTAKYMTPNMLYSYIFDSDNNGG